MPGTLNGDGQRFKQVLINLVKNALKFTRRGYVMILISFDAPNELIYVQVSDSGKGIAVEEIPKLCQKFGKLLRTAEMNSEGVGLGLMISKALVEENGGQLEIKSEGPDQGSDFIFSMKMTAQEGSEMIDSPSKLIKLRSSKLIKQCKPQQMILRQSLESKLLR